MADASAMILAAGFGTRLRPLTDELAKPLVWIGDRAALQHVADVLFGAGVRQVVVNIHHRTADFDALAGDRVRLIHEHRILGTAGGVRNAASLLGDGDATVWNGDVLADVDLGALEADHAGGEALATLVVAPRAPGEGTVGVGGGGQVVRLRGRIFGREVSGGDFLGIQRISRELRARLPVEGCLVGDVYLPALERGERLRVTPHAGGWTDVGSLAAYLEANLAWLSHQQRTSFLHPTVVVAPGVSCVDVVALRGAELSGSGLLERVVVWPGAHVVAPLRDAVVTPRGTVAVPR